MRSPEHAAEDGLDLMWHSVDGLTLHARDYPAAAGASRLPVFCLHGLTRNARDFDRLAPWIARSGRRVLAIDVRGRGRSDRDPAADYRLPTYAEDVVALAEAAGIARAVFIGTSMGGLITIELARRAPALVAAAIVNDIGPVLAPAGLSRIAGYVGRAPHRAGWEAAADYLREQNAQALPHYRAEDWLGMARRMFRAVEGGVIADYDPAIAHTVSPAIGEDESWARWANLVDGRPVLLLRGELSDLLDRDVAKRMTHGGQARLVEVEKVGHAPMLDEPAALAAIADFLETVD